MIHLTKGIVLRTVKYGETSVVATVFTELFGVQSYMVNGVRTNKKTVKAHFFQPGSILDLEVYHNELRNLQRIKEMRWEVVYRNIFHDVVRNAVSQFMVELLQKCLREPETNPELFAFCENAFKALDSGTPALVANMPVYFALTLPALLGFQIQNNYNAETNTLNLAEGSFTAEDFTRPGILNPALSKIVSEFLNIKGTYEIDALKLNRQARSSLLIQLENFYRWHISDFGQMKTLQILKELF